MAADPIPVALPEPEAVKPWKRKLVRRAEKDESQRLRFIFQAAFIALNLWVGAQFYLWVLSVEGTNPTTIARPDGVEGWLPIAALMNLKAWILTGTVPKIHPAGMFILLAFLLISVLMKKAFCSWLCPVGTISEGLWKLGRKMMRRNVGMPRWLDIPLRGLKYLLFGFFGWAVYTMSANAIEAFMSSPYGIIADVKMLNFFRFIGTTGLIVIAVLAVLSVFIQNFWCRYLCPYGALLGLVSLVSPARIRRDAAACIDCAKCAKACPSRLPVDRKPQIRSAECTLCMECVAVCPAAGALAVRVAPARTVPPRMIAAAIAIIFFGIVIGAKVTGNWKTEMPEHVYRALVASHDQIAHPR